MPRALAAVAAVALMVALPAGASAATRYVAKAGGSDSPGCTNQGTPCATITYAVGQAFDGDTIQIGPGTYAERVQTDKILTFVGAGAGSLDGAAAATLVHPPINDGFGYTAFELRRGGTLRSLRAEGGDADSSLSGIGDPGGAGVRFDSAFADAASLRLEDVVAVGGAGGPSTDFQGPGGEGAAILSEPGPVSVSMVDTELAGGPGILAEGLVIRGDAATGDMRLSRIANEDADGSGIHVGDGAELTLTEVDVASAEEAATVYDGRMTVMRSRLRSEAYRSLIVYALSGDSPDVEVIDSLITSVGYPAATLDSEEESAASLRLLGSTLVARGGDAAIVANGEEYGGPAALTLRNSVVRHLEPAGSALDLLAFKGGSVDASFSSFSSVEAKDGAAVTPPGSSSNIAGPPGFIDEGNGVFVPQSSSPLIDRGDPSLVQAGELDLLGAPRSVDGNLDCAAAPDVGAYEVIGRSVACPVDPRPVISKFGMTNEVFAPKGQRARRKAGASAQKRGKRAKRGTKFTYTLSEPARVTITIERKARKRKGKRRFIRVVTLSAQEKGGRQSTPFSGRVKGKALRRGRYRATIVATDAAGGRSEPRGTAFRIVPG